MANRSTIQCDGKSPLTRYVDLLIRVPEALQRRLDRDAEAIRLLTERALDNADNAIVRVKKARAGKTGRLVGLRRIWTRRDQRRVNLDRGAVEGCQPECRAARYLRRVASQPNDLFRAAFDEARRDGTASVICDGLKQAHDTFQRLLEAAHSLTQGNGGESEFDAAKLKLVAITSELLQWTKPHAGNAANRTDDELAHHPPSGTTVESASRDAERLARWLGALYACARDERRDQLKWIVEDCAKLLDGCLDTIESNKELFNTGDPAHVVQVGSHSYANAHVAAVEFANSFFEFLWFHIDRDHYEQATKEIPAKGAWIIHTGFNPELVITKWDTTKDVIGDQFDDKTREHLGGLAARIIRERAGLKATSWRFTPEHETVEGEHVGPTAEPGNAETAGPASGPRKTKTRNQFARIEELIEEMLGTNEKNALTLMVKYGGKMAYKDFIVQVGIEAESSDRSHASQLFGSLKTRLTGKLQTIGWLFDRKRNDVVISRKNAGRKKSRKSNSR